MDEDEREERDAFDEFSEAEKEAIRLLLECADPSQKSKSRYIQEWFSAHEALWNDPLPLAAMDVLGIVPSLAEQLAHKENWTDAGLIGDIFYGQAVRIASFCLRNNLIRTYAAFDFLFVRLFGGLARPLNPSLFVSALFHPDVGIEAFDPDEIGKAKWARKSGSGTHEPVWFPNRQESD